MVDSASFEASLKPLLVVLAIIGFLESAKQLLRLSNGIFKFFLRPGKNIKKLGSWAVVTGCTDGIGRAYAEALAKKGINLVLISRTPAKLKEAAEAIESKFKVKTKVLAVDFAAADNDTFKSIGEALQGLDIGILINNVGMSYNHAEYFDQIDDSLIDNIIQINIQGTNKMTRLVLPGMKAKKRGAIVNIGSAAATVAPSGPLYAVYAGTKAYVDMFSKSLNLEYGPYGISVQNQAPMYVTTKLAKIRKPSIDVPTPKRWVQDAIKHIGYEPSSSPYWVHGLMWGIVDHLPEWVMNKYLTRFHQDLRRRYYKKLEREGKKSS